MTLSLGPTVPLILGPTTFLIAALVVILLVLFAARIVFHLAWKLVLIGAVVLAGLWLLGALGPFSAALGP